MWVLTVYVDGKDSVLQSLQSALHIRDCTESTQHSEKQALQGSPTLYS